MKSAIIRFALTLCILALSSVPALALPPQCEEVCEFRSARYHCTNAPFGTITCGEFCTVYCPGSCGVNLQEETFSKALPGEAAPLPLNLVEESPEAQTPDSLAESAG